MKKIVLINQDSGYLMVDLANALIEKNADVELIAGRLVVRGTPLSNKAKFRKIARYKRTTAFSRLFTWIVGFLQILFIIRTKHKQGHLLIVSNPPLATLLPLFFRNSFTFFIFDVYPDTLGQMNIVSRQSVLYKIWESANIKTFKRAVHIFTLTDAMAELLNQYGPTREIKTIPAWSDNEFFRSIPKANNPFIIEHKLQNRFIIMYSGNLGATHDTLIIPRIASEVKSQKALFLIIGEGNQKKRLIEEIKRLQITNLILLPYQPVDTIPYSFASADIALVSLCRNASSLSIPSKTFNFMSAGLPLLCITGEGSELNNIVNKYNNGRCFSHEQVIEMAAFIDEIAENEDLLYAYRANSLKGAADYTSKNADIIAEEVIKAIST